MPRGILVRPGDEVPVDLAVRQRHGAGRPGCELAGGLRAEVVDRGQERPEGPSA
ncbi:MAG: hypothetical protein M3O64_03130 [Chloroflexota bacterium]|nr:hypothetical protein [Chloroflexota bacterium]